MEPNINSYVDNIVKGLQERDSDIFYDFHAFGDVDEDGHPLNHYESGPGRYQISIENLCVAAGKAETIIRRLNDRLDDVMTSELKALEVTPEPWTVLSHPDTEGAYIIREACNEQQQWAPDGYDISEEEGELRGEVVALHDAGNIRLIEMTPVLLGIVRDLACLLGKGQPQIVEVTR